MNASERFESGVKWFSGRLAGMLLTESSPQSKIAALEKFACRPFIAAPLLRNGHVMTIIGTQRPRRFSILKQPGERREFQTEPGTRVVA